MIPNTFENWRNCIIHDCKIDLNKDFAQQRLAVYQDKENSHTQQFISLYGEQHLENVIMWFSQI